LAFTDLNETEQNVVRECLRATVHGDFFPEWEFQTLFGLSREQVEQVLESWPKINDSDESVALSINNSLVNLLGYPYSDADGKEWKKFISVPATEVARILTKW
jgi:hypothetical protein